MTEDSKNYSQLVSAVHDFVNVNTQIHPDLTVMDKEAWMAITPPGKTWDVLLTDNILGFENESILVANNIWDTMAPGGHSAWESAATALNTPFKCLDQLAPGGVCGDKKTPGYVFFVYTHALFYAELTPNYFVTPPIYK